jgi:transporter family protein
MLAWGIVFAQGGIQTIGSLTRVNWIFLGLSGAATGLSWIFYFKALQLSNISQVASIDKLSVALTVILAFVFLKEPPTVKALAGTPLIICGTIVLIWK